MVEELEIEEELEFKVFRADVEHYLQTPRRCTLNEPGSPGSA